MGSPSKNGFNLKPRAQNNCWLVVGDGLIEIVFSLLEILLMMF